MKNIYKFLLGLCTVFPALTSCEKDLPVYNNEACGLMFEYKYERDSVFGYSFAFGPSDVTIDTVFMKVSLLGNVTDYDRPIALQQVLTGKNDARPGEHYVPFDDPSLASKYILPAKATSATIPVVFKRDATLKSADYILKLTFKPNEAFTFAAKERAYRTLTVSDQLLMPNNWRLYCQHFFGRYGKVKHQFMIDVTGFRWDNEYVDNEVKRYLSSDQNVLFGLQYKLRDAVKQYNATHKEPLWEGEEYDNALVKF